MISISSIDEYGYSYEACSFSSIEEAEEKLSLLDAALDDASSYEAFQIKDAMVQLQEAITEAKSSLLFILEDS